VAAAIVLVVMTAPRPASAIFDKKFDWKDGHKLKVCLKDNGCPAGMLDSLKAAMGLWNAKNLSWTFTYEPDCDKANITVSCEKQASLGATSSNWSSKANTKATVKISKDADFGWCDDKYELVSTLVHELGHCARLDDTPAADQSKVMRGAQNKAGHSRGPSADDVKEAEASDTTVSIAMVTNPPGGRFGTTYTGVLTPALGAPPFNLGHAIHVALASFDSTQLRVLGFTPLGPEQIQWGGQLTAHGWDMAPLFLTIQYPESTAVRQGIVQITDRNWQQFWLPHVVAPQDTVVASDTSMVVLYHLLSSHPAGPQDDVMTFSWLVDGAIGYKGGPDFSITLPMGVHQIMLTGTDEMGVQALDGMNVTVLAATGVPDEGPGRNAAGLWLAFPSPFTGGQSLPIAYDVMTAGRASLRVYDVQGRLVSTLFDDVASPGRHRVDWSMHDVGGTRVRAGAYFLTLRSGDSILTRRIILVP
jgi:hypothetical protein